MIIRYCMYLVCDNNIEVAYFIRFISYLVRKLAVYRRSLVQKWKGNHLIHVRNTIYTSDIYTVNRTTVDVHLSERNIWNPKLFAGQYVWAGYS